jgi:hypothetical protein
LTGGIILIVGKGEVGGFVDVAEEALFVFVDVDGDENCGTGDGLTNALGSNKKGFNLKVEVNNSSKDSTVFSSELFQENVRSFKFSLLLSLLFCARFRET